jgi:hypothetical protein
VSGRLRIIRGILLASACLAGGAQATVISKTFRFPRPTIIREGETCRARIEGLPLLAQPGEPLLPVHTFSFVLPQGERVLSVAAVVLEEQEIEIDLPLKWEEHPLLLGYEGPVRRVSPSQTVYAGQAAFPRTHASHVTTQTCRGYDIAYVRIYPITYVGARGILRHATRLEVAIETGPAEGSGHRRASTLREENTNDRARVSSTVDDATYLDSYVRSERPLRSSALVDPAQSYPHVIISHSLFGWVFQDLKDLRDRQGLRTNIVLVSDIAAAYTGIDLQEKIRNFITDAYLHWETEYVLLAGDDEFIPHRGLYAEILPYVTDPDVAADLYYGALDGNWNDDGDSYWGEPGEADLIPDLSVGRAPVGHTLEAANFVSKLVRYETAPVVTQITNAQLTAELLYSEPTWGADSKEEIIGGTDAHGFTTVGIPADWNFSILFDRDLHPAEWTKWDVIDNLNSGTHITNHLGHSINDYTMKMYNADVQTQITNDGIANTYFVAFIQGCFSAAFDNRTTNGSYVGDAIGEYFVNIPNGAVSYIGTTRYGASAHESTRGAGHYYDRQFFDAIFGEGITAIGAALDDAKIDNIPYIDFRGIRWTHYACVLLGDPAMDIWTDTPGTLTIELPDAAYVGENEVQFRVTDSASPVAGARISLFTDDTYNAVGITDASGIVSLDPAVTAPGSLYVAVKAHNYSSALDTLPVFSADMPLLVVDSVLVDDDGSGQSAGDADGMIDAGETLETTILLQNVGAGAAVDAQGALGSSDPYVTISQPSGAYGTIDPGATVTPSWSFVFSVSPSVPDLHQLPLTLSLAYNDTSVVRHVSLPAHAPALAVSDVSFDDTTLGNGNGCLDPGESVELSVCFRNEGTAGAVDVSLQLEDSDPYLDVISAAATIPDIPAGEERGTSSPFVVGIVPACPAHARIDLHFDIDYSCARTESCSTAMYVGGSLASDFESGAPAWSHAEIVPGFVDEWHLESFRNHTPGGGTSWKCGGPGAEKYTHYSHGALVSPELCLGAGATLTFWHWIRVELEGGNYASDGGIVEISTDGSETWTQITPLGGYTHAIYPGTSTPIPPNTPCFGWTADWTEIRFDLSAYEGAARIRFNFGGGEHFESEEGWYVDDVVVADDATFVHLTEDLAPAPAAFALHPVYPNPTIRWSTLRFDIPRRAEVTIRVYDVSGRLVNEVLDAPYAPGQHTFPLDCDGKAAGIYFVRMETPEFEATRKVTILK